MSNDFITNAGEGISHREIILRLLQKVTEISTTEFRAGWKEQVTSGNQTHIVYHPSTIAGYIQTIDSLADVLLPFFDETMTEKYSTFKKEIDNLKENLEKEMEEVSKRTVEKHKLRIYREMFQQLNLLLSRIDYLKGN